jgi:hypothetical protein
MHGHLPSHQSVHLNNFYVISSRRRSELDPHCMTVTRADPRLSKTVTKANLCNTRGSYLTYSMLVRHTQLLQSVPSLGDLLLALFYASSVLSAILY